MTKLQRSLLCILAAMSTSWSNALATDEKGSLPRFLENKGQVRDQFNKSRPDVLYSGSIGGMVYHLRARGASYQFTRIDSWIEEEDIKLGRKIKRPERSTIYRIDLDWQNCNANVIVRGEGVQPGYDNYYTELCPAGANNVKTYAGVFYENIYKGIDLHYYEKNGSLKYDYLVAAGADYKQIQVSIKGATKISLGSQGELQVVTPLGIMCEPAPLVLQGRNILKAKWVIKNNVLSFDIADVDTEQPLIIDPMIRAWGTYYGYAEVLSTSTDATGNVYIAGLAGNFGSSALIASSGAHQVSCAGNDDAYVAKFDKFGVRLWGTYYGGSDSERGYACAVDPSGNVYLAGYSASSAMATVGSHQSSLAGTFPNGLLVKLNSSGARLWATYYGGGPLQTVIYGCATDANGNVYAAGITDCNLGISTSGSYQQWFGGNSDAFLVKFDASGARQWGTYYGGSGDDFGITCATDPSGNIYLSGNADANTPAGTSGAFQPNFIGGVDDAFLVKFDPAGARLWATFYGSTLAEGGDRANGCATDNAGNVYLCGVVGINYTATPAPPPGPTTLVATPGSYQPLPGNLYQNAYLVKFDALGTRQWGTFYGLNGGAMACAADALGNVYLAGGTSPTSVTAAYATSGCHQPVFGGGGSDAWMAKFDAAGVRQYATFYGGTAEDVPFSCSVDPAGNFYMAGLTSSSNGNSIATLGSQQAAYQGTTTNGNGFLVKLTDCSPIISSVTQTNVVCPGDATGVAVVNASAVGSSMAYSWIPNGGTSNTATGLSAGSYTCIITGSCGIVHGEVVTIPAPPMISLSVAPTKTMLCAGETSTLTVNGTGGTGVMTYSWSGGVSGSGATVIIQPSAQTFYTVTATDANGCSSTGTVTQNVSQCLFIETLSDDLPLSVYPNPASSEITVHVHEEVFVTLYNATGQKMFTKNMSGEKNTISLVDHAAGIYFLEVKGQDRVKIVKLVKE